MAQARIERKVKFTVMLSAEEASELSIACQAQRTTAAALVRRLIRDEGHRSLRLQPPDNETFNEVLARKKKAKKKR